MVTALFLGLGIFTSCWLLHVIVWHVRRPDAYPIWLPIIFLLTPAVAAFATARFGVALPIALDLPTVLAAFLLHSAIAACYMGGYAGIIEYSPSAEILRVVQNHMPHGIAPEALNVTSLSEQALTGKRIMHLTESRMAVSENGSLKVTPRGHVIVAICGAYRAIFGLKQEAKG